jgi:NAD(P)H-nitrite reductase large subunit
MAGGDKSFNDAIPMNAIGFFGFHILSAGSYTGEEHTYTTEKGMKKLFIEDGVLKGFMLIGDVEKAGIYTSLVRNRTPISQIDFEKICKSPTLAAFSEKNRANMLGGVV